MAVIRRHLFVCIVLNLLPEVSEKTTDKIMSLIDWKRVAATHIESVESLI